MTRNTPFGGPITPQRQAFKFMLKRNEALHRRGLLKLHMEQKQKRRLRDMDK
jgi:hypothetical protein